MRFIFMASPNSNRESLNKGKAVIRFIFKASPLFKGEAVAAGD